MHSSFNIGNIAVPAYGLMVTLGIMVVNVIASIVARKKNIRQSLVLLLELIVGTCAVIGAKLLSIFFAVLSKGNILGLSWEIYRTSGYAFYGALILGLASFRVATLFLKVDMEQIASSFGFLAPLLHAFWKMGCLLGGCCYGIPYNGPFAIVFPKGTEAPAEINLFPVQIVEMLVVLIIAAVLYLYGRKQKKHVIEVYLIFYGLARSVIELFRFHNYISIFWCNEIISLGLVIGSISSLAVKYRRENS